MTARETTEGALVDRLLDEVLLSGDIEALPTIVHPNVRVSDVAFDSSYQGIDEYAGHFEMMRNAFSDIRMTHEILAACDGVVTVEYEFTGRNTGPFMGQDPSGRDVSFRGIDVYTVVDGKIAEVRGSFDLYGLRAAIEGEEPFEGE